VYKDYIKRAIDEFKVETPAWAYGDSGTRFKVFRQDDSAKAIFEKIDAAALVNAVTGGVCPTVAVHVDIDIGVISPKEVKDYAAVKGLKIGAVNPTLYAEDCYKFGSFSNPDPAVQKKALKHIEKSIEVMRKCDSKVMSLWFADGTNYPGQDNLVARKRRMKENLKRTHDMLDEDMLMLVEYKFFEPAFYSTDIGDWGMSYVFSKACGPRAQVLVDLGHHPLGTNIEQIVAFLIDEKMLGGFHFNSKKYADDDLTTGSANPHELFLIFNELVGAAGGISAYKTAYMIDQGENLKPKVPAMIQSVLNILETYLKALSVDRAALEESQSDGDIIRGENILKKAFFTDVRLVLLDLLSERGADTAMIRKYLCL
jgi:L-rhamnose isomerase/sugar isomerase